MRAYWFDNLPGDQRLPHDSGNSVSKAHLFDLGIQYYSFPIDDASSSLSLSSSLSTSSSSSDHSHSTDTANNSIHTDPNLISSFPSTPISVDALARSRGYTNCDQVTISPDTFGEAYESKVRAFFDEHLHEDEEIRYILDGSGYFDVRAQTQSQTQSQSQAQAQAKAQATKDSDGEGWIRIRLERGDLIILPAGIYHRFTTDDANYTKAMRLFQDEPKWTPLNRNAETDINAHRLKYLSQRGQS